MERIRIAVWKLSDGSMSKLRMAAELPKSDWRDALAAAGFGDDPQAHKSWMPAPRA